MRNTMNMKERRKAIWNNKTMAEKMKWYWEQAKHVAFGAVLAIAVAVAAIVGVLATVVGVGFFVVCAIVYTRPWPVAFVVVAIAALVVLV